MIQALSDQIKYSNSTIHKYGFDISGLIDYKFNSSGFRNDFNFELSNSADIVFAGGSISLGIGVANCDAYKTVVATCLDKTMWDVSYAYEFYSNKIIYETIMQVYEHIGDRLLVIQWVSDMRAPDSITVYDYIQEVNKKFSTAVHIFIDGREDPKREYFDLVNPPWFGTTANGTHPDAKTHNGIAKFILKKLNHVTRH